MFKVILQSCGNPDHGEFDIINPATCCILNTIDECRKAVRDYIEDNGLGAGNWCGGRVIETETNAAVGRISYNGRFWGTDSVYFK